MEIVATNTVSSQLPNTKRLKHHHSCQNKKNRKWWNYQQLSFFSGTYKMIDDEGVNKRCLPGCTSQSFTATLSESIYPYPHFIWDKKFCMVVKKLKKTCKSERKHTLGNNHLLVLFKFFFLCLWTKRALIFHYYFLINLKRFLRRFDQSFLKSLLYESNTKPLP